MADNQVSPTDVPLLRRRLAEVAQRRAFVVEELGHVGGQPILLMTSPPALHGPHILVAAGFHGEEPAGCWGALRFLEQVEDGVLGRVNLSLLPLVNPTGIRKARRFNDWGQNPNSGFCHTPSGVPQPSREGELLLANVDLLCDKAADGFLSLHEDIDETSFYIYSFEQSTSPGPFSDALVEVESRFFDRIADGILEGGEIRGGVIFNHCDGSFEDALFHRGIPRTACTETPGQLPFERRVEANAAIVERFCHFSVAQR